MSEVGLFRNYKLQSDFSNLAIVKPVLHIMSTLFIVLIIELARRSEIKLPFPFLWLLFSVFASGWNAGIVAGGMCSAIAASYLYYGLQFGFLPAVLPDWNQGVFVAMAVFVGAGLISARFKVLKERSQEDSNRFNAELLRRELMYQTLAETSHDVIIRFDREFRYTYLNPALALFTGNPPEKYLGKTLREMDWPERLCDKWEKSITQVFKTGKPDTLIFETKDQDGITKTIDWRAFPEINGDGKVESVINVSRDITERRQTEKEQYKLQKLDSLGVLAGGIAHDLNNILTVLFGNISLIKNTIESNHEALGYIGKADEAFERATALSNQLLTFSKDGNMVKENLSLDKLIKKVTDFDLTGSNVKSVFKVEDCLWPIKVDKGQMEQVFSNLVTNANQAMPEGGHLHITMENVDFKRRKDSDDSKHGRYIKTTVRDEGVGIESKYLDQVFDPYFSTKATGNGLGLATVFTIVAKHDGYIRVASTPGEGTIFSIFLPAIEEQGMIKKVQQAQAVNETEIIKQPGRILIVDDDEAICELAKNILIRKGYLVDKALDGELAIKMYQQAMDVKQPYQCIIMDLTIPGGIGGKEGIQKILDIDPLARAIVTSGYSVDPVIINYEEYGFKGTVAKPFTVDYLLEEVARVLV